MSDSRWSRLRSVFRRSERTEVGDELSFHIDMRARELIEQGMDPARAHELAERRFGPVQPIEEVLVDSTRRRRKREDRAEAFTDLTQDARYAVRTLLRAPGFAVVSILTIALGIGATTAIFSVVDAVLLRPLPYPRAQELVIPQSQLIKTEERWNVTYRDFLTWQRDSVFESVALVQEPELDITGACGGSACEPERATIALVTQDFFHVLGVKPLIGRFPQPDEFRPGSPRPLVISYALWQRRYGGQRSVVGSAVRMTGVPVNIVGVMPEGVVWPKDVDAWFPYRQQPNEGTLAPDNAIFSGVARLWPDRTLEQTRSRLATLAQIVAKEFPAKRLNVTVTARPMRDYAVPRALRSALWVLLGAVAFVLVIACVNVANLMLARATARERELTLRTALGAGRWRLVRQLLTESLVLAIAGGALGVLIAIMLSRALVAMAPPDILSVAARVELNMPTLAVAAAATLLASVLFGLVPAVKAGGTRPAQALAERSGRTSGGRRQRRAAAALVVAEVALSLTLLTGAGLLVKSLMRLRNVETGLDVHRALTFEAALPQARFSTGAAIAAFWDEYLRRIRALPGVTAASVATALPLGGGGFYLGRTMIEAGAPEPPAGSEVGIMWNEVGTQYFKAVGQPLIAGREFDERDDTTASPKIIVTRAFAEKMFPGKSAADVIGRNVFSWRDERLRREIVGIVGNVRHEGATDGPRPIVYVPTRQSPRSSLAVIIRANGSARDVAAAARRELASIDPGMAMANLRTMEETLARSIAPQRFNAILFGAFAVLAVLLASIGLYGVLSYGVARETREIGVRMALGASPGGVKRRVLARSLALAGAGAAVGLGGSFLMTRALGSLLFEVRPSDPATYAAVTTLLLGVAALAAWLPARRATKVDPATALRSE